MRITVTEPLARILTELLLSYVGSQLAPPRIQPGYLVPARVGGRSLQRNTMAIADEGGRWRQSSRRYTSPMRRWSRLHSSWPPFGCHVAAPGQLRPVLDVSQFDELERAPVHGRSCFYEDRGRTPLLK